MFSVAGIIGIFVLVPVNYLGDQLSIDDFSDLPNKSIDLFSISNVDNGSNRSIPSNLNFFLFFGLSSDHT